MSQPSMDIGSIAIVEDEPVVRRLMRLWLEADGYTVVEYSSGREAALHDTDGTAIVCLDLRLEDVPGQSVLAELRARDPDLPIIVVTGDQDLETATLAMRAGAYDYVTKPFDRERLGQAVRRAVERRQLTASVRRLRRELDERAVRSSALDESAARSGDGGGHEPHGSFDDAGPALGSSERVGDSEHPPEMVGQPGQAGLPEIPLANDVAVGGGSTLNLREIERVAIAQALKLAGGSVGKAAKLLGIGRATLYRRLSEQRAPIGHDEGSTGRSDIRPHTIGSDAGPGRQSEMRSHNAEGASKFNGHVART